MLETQILRTTEERHAETGKDFLTSEKHAPYLQTDLFIADTYCIKILTYLHCCFGHPCEGYEHFFLQVETRTQHTHKGEQHSNQQSNEQRGLLRAVRL